MRSTLLPRCAMWVSRVSRCDSRKLVLVEPRKILLKGLRPLLLDDFHHADRRLRIVTDLIH